MLKVHKLVTSMRDFTYKWSDELTPTVAEFYLSELIKTYERKAPNNVYMLRCMRRNAECLDSLAEFFKTYIFIACAGEVRYIREQAHDVSMKLPKWTPKCRSRTGAWQKAYNTYSNADEIGLIRKVTELSSLFHEAHWAGAFGGVKWGDIAVHLLEYLSGKRDKVWFVDHAVDLSHNNQIFVDKLGVSMSEYLSVLDMKQEMRDIHSAHATDLARIANRRDNSIDWQEVVLWLRIKSKS